VGGEEGQPDISEEARNRTFKAAERSGKGFELGEEAASGGAVVSV